MFNQALYVTGEIFVGILAIIGNLLVVYVFYSNRRLRSYRNYYVLGLAIADCMIGLVGIPLAILASFSLPRNLYGCLFTCCSIIICCAVSILCLLAVSIDRFWATFNPITYHKHMNAKIACGILFLCTFLGTLLGLLPMFGWYNHSGFDGTKCRFDEIMDYDFLAFKYFVVIVFPAILMACFYGYIYRFIRIRTRRQSQSQSLATGLNFQGVDSITETEATNRDKAKHKEAKAGKKLSCIILFFLICWMPLNTINCIHAFYPHLKKVTPFELIQFTIILSHANSAINPFLYAYHLKEFRITMKNALISLLSFISCGLSWMTIDSAVVTTQSQSFTPNVNVNSK